MEINMRKVRYIKMLAFFLVLIFLASNVSAQGHFEFGFHYSTWSINIFKSLIEEELSDALGTDVKDGFVSDIQEEHPFLYDRSYNQEVNFDSNGNNYGFELRWYPGGENSSVSVGLSVEKTSMKVSIIELAGRLELEDQLTEKTANFQGNASGEILLKPLSFHLSFRWDIIPSSRIHPYITLGLGAATGAFLEEAEYSYSYRGKLTISGEESEDFEGGEKKTLKELKDELEAEEEDFFLPGLIPFIQLNLGLKVRMINNLHLLLDVGVWNGFLIRGGISYCL